MPEVILKRAHRGPVPSSARWGPDPVKTVMDALASTPTYRDAAKKLGVAEVTLYRYIKKFDIRPVWDENTESLIFDN